MPEREVGVPKPDLRAKVLLGRYRGEVAKVHGWPFAYLHAEKMLNEFIEAEYKGWLNEWARTHSYDREARDKEKGKLLGYLYHGLTEMGWHLDREFDMLYRPDDVVK